MIIRKPLLIPLTRTQGDAGPFENVLIFPYVKRLIPWDMEKGLFFQPNRETGGKKDVEEEETLTLMEG